MFKLCHEQPTWTHTNATSYIIMPRCIMTDGHIIADSTRLEDELIVNWPLSLGSGWGGTSRNSLKLPAKMLYSRRSLQPSHFRVNKSIWWQWLCDITPPQDFPSDDQPQISVHSLHNFTKYFTQYLLCFEQSTSHTFLWKVHCYNCAQ